MPLRRRLTSAQLLALIGSNAGSSDARSAKRLLALADTVGAQQIKRQASISVRFVAPERIRRPLTLYLIHDDGMVTVWYAYLWERAKVPARVVKEYERGWANVVGEEVLHQGVRASEVVKRWEAIEPLIAGIVTTLAKYLDTELLTAPPASRSLNALEGVIREVKSYRRSRSTKLRTEALRRAGGCCECCDVEFGTMLGGRGVHVLQVHHVDQLALRDQPSVTNVDQLSVVCANCHLLIHADPADAMTLGAVRSLWRKQRTSLTQRSPRPT
jgi:hypothetical protein